MLQKCAQRREATVEYREEEEEEEEAGCGAGSLGGQELEEERGAVG